MKIIVIGAVAAGTSAAAKASRNDKTAQIAIYEQGRTISYSSCGMPYYIGGHVAARELLAPRDPAYFKRKYNVDVFTEHRVLAIDPNAKTIQVKKLATGAVFTDRYDVLILATGAKAVLPPIAGIDGTHVFSLRSIADMDNITDFIRRKNPQQAVVIGTGFIGLELCENLSGLGISTTLVERQPQIVPGLDSDMAAIVQAHVISKGAKLITNNGVASIGDDHVTLASGEQIGADMVIVAAGVKPDTDLARQAGIAVGVAGAIKVNRRMQTNLQDIYACGDCIEQFHAVTGAPVYRPLGSTANKTGRIAGDCATGGALEFRGVLGTGISRAFDLTIAQTGLSEREAREQGYEIVVSHDQKPNKATYLGGQRMIIKAVADKSNGRLLGVQILGAEGVDKRIDVFATAIAFGAKVEDLFHLDLAYAPPYSLAKDPVMYTGMILDNAMKNTEEGD